MSNEITKNASLNILFAIVLQIVSFIKGLIVPRMIIPVYGSDVNGLISSIIQFLTYISLLEAGVGSVFRASLYKPLANGDMDSVSGIINEQKRFYKKIGFIFIGYVAVLCFVYPLLAKTQIPKEYIISFILILSVNTFMEYFVSLPYVSLLSADQKIRISYIVSIIYTTVNVVVTLIFVTLKADIRLIYLSMCVIGLLRPLFYFLYIKRKYALSKNALPDGSALSQRWNGMVHHIAYYIHTNTDILILTVFIGTATVSVYSLYAAIIMGIEKVITSISTGSAAGMGKMLALGDKERIDNAMDVFEFIQSGVTTVLYTVTALLLIPFMRIYTATMTDMNYIVPEFGYVLVFAEAVYCFRCIYSTVSSCANKFKETQWGAILECSANLVLSVLFVLVFKMGLLGVALGTAVGMFARYVFEICFLTRNVLNRKIVKPLKSFAVNALIAGVSILICYYVVDYSSIITFWDWIVKALITGAIVLFMAAIVYLFFYYKMIRTLFLKLRRRLQ